MMKKSILIAALGLFSLNTMAQDTPKEEGFVFTTVKENPITSIKNQNRAGTCWCYSGLAFIESELLRMGKGEYDLSEMFIVHNTYLDRADKAVRTHGDISFSQGGSFYDVIYGMKTFGLVPEEEMRPGVMYGYTLSNHNGLTAVSDAVVAAIAKGNHRKLQQKYPQYADVRIAFNEYAYENVTNPSRLKDGMGIGVFLNTVLDNADVFEMCCYSSTVNATQGCITTEADGAVMQGAGYVLSLYRRWMQPYNVTSAVRYAADIQLDVSATVSEDGKTVSVAVVNPSEYAVLLDCALFENASKIERHTLTGDYYDSYNTTSREEMYLEDADGLNNAVAPAMSVSVFVVERG